MGWRTILVTKPCKLSLQDRQLLYEPEGSEAVTVPVEDVSVVILETKYALITSALLTRLAESGAVVFSCGDNHIPTGAFFPFHKHSRYSEIAEMQAAWSAPFKKRVWQEIVKQKITNQAAFLKTAAIPSWENLERMAARVQSGDTENHEAQAAKLYWESLFTDFTRVKDDWRNSSLNYGYAIIRGAVARSLVGAGLLPCFGLNHSNGLNAFNLADDIIEPFRAFVDRKVFLMFKARGISEVLDLLPTDKQELAKLLGEACFIAGENTTLLSAADTACFSLVSATRSKDPKDIKLPKFIPLNEPA
jgi:CRISPR-associated protein Cas1